MTNDKQLIHGVFYNPLENIIYISFPKGCTCGCHGLYHEPCAFCESVAAHFQLAGSYPPMSWSIHGTPESFLDWYYQWMLGSIDPQDDNDVAESIIKNDNRVFDDRKQRLIAEFKAAYYDYVESEVPLDWIPRWISDLMGIDEGLVNKLIKILIKED